MTENIEGILCSGMPLGLCIVEFLGCVFKFHNALPFRICGPRVDVPNSNIKYFGHIYSNGLWFGVDLRMDTKKTSVSKRLDYMHKMC